MVGKYLAEWFLIKVVRLTGAFSIRWWVAALSALIGTYSHVFIDSIMHGDLQPWFPFNTSNALLGLVSVSALHKICLYCGIAGTPLYFAVARLSARKSTISTNN